MKPTPAGWDARCRRGAIGLPALAQSFVFTPNRRYPDPAVQFLDPSFAKYPAPGPTSSTT